MRIVRPQPGVWQSPVVIRRCAAGGIVASLIIGALAGLIPALRAARLSPSHTLWSV